MDGCFVALVWVVRTAVVTTVEGVFRSWVPLHLTHFRRIVDGMAGERAEQNVFFRVHI